MIKTVRDVLKLVDNDTGILIREPVYGRLIANGKRYSFGITELSTAEIKSFYYHVAGNMLQIDIDVRNGRGKEGT